LRSQATKNIAAYADNANRNVGSFAGLLSKTVT